MMQKVSNFVKSAVKGAAKAAPAVARAAPGAARAITAAGGPEAAAVGYLAPKLADVARQSHAQGSQQTPGVSPHQSTPGVTFAGSFDKMRKAPETPKTNSPELTKATSGQPTTFQQSKTVGPDTSKFTPDKPAVAPKPAAAPKPSSPLAGKDLQSTISSIAKSNKIADPNKIYAGKTLDLGGGDKYTIQKGDNLTKIAKGFYGSGSKASPQSSTTPEAKGVPSVPAPKPAAATASTSSAPAPMMKSFEPAAPMGSIPKMSDQNSMKQIKEEVQVGENKYRIV